MRAVDVLQMTRTDRIPKLPTDRYLFFRLVLIYGTFGSRTFFTEVVKNENIGILEKVNQTWLK